MAPTSSLTVRARGGAALALWLALACSALGGCAALVPKLEAPQLQLIGVTLVGGDAQQQQIRLALHVVNPNERAIDVRGIECALEIEGRPIAQGATAAAIALPAMGETDFDLNVNAHLSDALGPLLAARILHSSLRYRLYGQVHLRSGIVRNIPFDQNGQFRL
jgi:LEA14-like dessication related protein